MVEYSFSKTSKLSSQYHRLSGLVYHKIGEIARACGELGRALASNHAAGVYIINAKHCISSAQKREYISLFASISSSRRKIHAKAWWDTRAARRPWWYTPHFARWWYTKPAAWIKKSSFRRTRIFCQEATKKIFLSFLNKVSNSHGVLFWMILFHPLLLKNNRN